MPNFLAQLLMAGASNVQPYTYLNATSTALGTAFGTGISNTPTVRNRNTVIQAGGKLYAMSRTAIYTKDDTTLQTGTWSVDHTFDSTEAAARRSGLYVVTVSDVPYLFCWYGRSGDSDGFYLVRKNLVTGVWSESGNVTGPTGTNYGTGLDGEALWRNVLYGTFITGHNQAAFDPSTLTSLTINRPSTISTPNSSLCVFEDRLFMLYRKSDRWTMAEHDGGNTWSDFDDVAGPTLSFTSWQATHRTCMFVHEGKLYALMGSSSWNGGGWKCFELDVGASSFNSVTDISSTVLPSGLLTVGSAINNNRIAAVYDQDTDPVTGDVYLFHSADGSSGTTYAMYKWNGNSALIGSSGSPNDTGGDALQTLPGNDSSGESYFTPGELDILITGFSTTTGGLILTFRAYGAAGSADKTVKFYYSDKDRRCLTQATLTGSPAVVSGSPAGTPTRNGNQIEGLDADGSVEYSITWLSSTDGFTAGTRARLKPFVSV